MASTYDIMKRIQKYDGVNLFLVLDKNGKKLNPELEDDEKKNVQNVFGNNYENIHNLVNKAVSCSRDIDQVNELIFLQISYSGYEFLIAPDDDQCVFAAYQIEQPKPTKRY